MVKDVGAKVSCEIHLLEKVVSLQRVRKNKLSNSISWLYDKGRFSLDFFWHERRMNKKNKWKWYKNENENENETENKIKNKNNRQTVPLS